MRGLTRVVILLALYPPHFFLQRTPVSAIITTQVGVT